MRFEFHPEALEEYEEAALWYSERDLGVALRFIDAVEDTIGRILETPARWPVIEEECGRCLTRVFPYGILYTIESDFILVVAVMHCSREPGYWKTRAGKL
jgi:plasmid stabilization system protein ParE